MFGLQELGRLLLILGGVIVVVGLLLLLGAKIPWLGRLPGDIHIQRGNISCFFPLATSILLSIILTVVLNIILRILRK